MADSSFLNDLFQLMNQRTGFLRQRESQFLCGPELLKDSFQVISVKCRCFAEHNGPVEAEDLNILTRGQICLLQKRGRNQKLLRVLPGLDALGREQEFLIVIFCPASCQIGEVDGIGRG